LDAGICTEDELTAIDDAAKQEVAEAVEYALAATETTQELMFEDVYADPTVVPRRGVYPVREAEAALSGETRSMGMFEAIISAQDNALEADPAVILMGEDIGDPPGGVFKTSAGLQTKWGAERVR